MVQGRRSRQRAPGPRRRPAWLHAPCSMLHAPPWATGHGQDPAHRTPNIPPVPPSAGDGLHCVEIQLLHCRASRRYGPPAAACWLAGLAGLGGEGGARGGEPGVESGLGDVERWGAMGETQTGKRCLRCRRPSFQARPLGADTKGHDGERRRRDFRCACWTDHASSTPWLPGSPWTAAIGPPRPWDWRRVGTATPHRLKGVAPANRLTARHSPPARPPCPPSLSRAGLGPSDWPGGRRPSWGTGTPRRWPFCSCMSPPFVLHTTTDGPAGAFFFFFCSRRDGDSLATTTTTTTAYPHHHSFIGDVHRRPPTRP